MPMFNQFSQVPTADINRNEFDRSCTYKTTLDSGYLVPVFFDEVLPGDTKVLNTTFFGRLSTPFVPVLDNIYLDYHLFFVPNRLLWDNWQKFMGERKNPSDSIDYLVPTITAGSDGFSRGGLLDYFTVPTAISNLSASSLIFYLRAYNLIWNEWYRDENLQNSVDVPTDDGPDTEDMYPLLKRGKRQDYFTSCLPQPQKGAGVELPLGGTCPIVGEATVYTQAGATYANFVSSSNVYGALRSASNGGSSINVQTDISASAAKGRSTNLYADGSQLYADLTSATAATINSLRQAIALQQFLEQDMRGGTRYVELILSHFGVQCPDYRLQRPEYLGGGTSRLNISPIAQTSSTDSTSPQGNLAAYCTVSSTNNGFTKSFTEHGVILGIVSVRCDLTYQQGLDRHFSRSTRYDYFFPTLAHLGEQSVFNKEIYAQGTDVDDEVFGYQERFGEYRYKNSCITGKFRSSDPQSLDVWHLAQYFTSLPTLSSDFIEENPPLERILAVTDEPQLLLDCYHDFKDIRPIPLYGVPGLRRV